uniref:Uncharacterized protein n=1 Tax=Setaria italica TaxID=4555 RepID=K4AP57_SETIT
MHHVVHATKHTLSLLSQLPTTHKSKSMLCHTLFHPSPIRFWIENYNQINAPQANWIEKLVIKKVLVQP